MFLLSARAFCITAAEIPVDAGPTSHDGTKPIVDALTWAHGGR